VQWIVERLTNTWGEGASWVLNLGDHPHEAHYLKLDCSKAKARLKWYPRWHLQTTLESIIEWNKQRLAGESMKNISLQQIAGFGSSITHLRNAHD